MVNQTLTQSLMRLCTCIRIDGRFQLGRTDPAVFADISDHPLVDLIEILANLDFVFRRHLVSSEWLCSAFELAGIKHIHPDTQFVQHVF